MKHLPQLALAAIALAAVGTVYAQKAHTAQPPMPGRYGVDEVCRDLNMYDNMKVTVPLLLRLDERQTQSWKGVETALTDARKPVEAGCGRLSAIPETGAATTRAARLEVVLNSSLDALRRVRPSFDRFYATLNDGQRKQVDKLFENAPL